MVRGGFVDVFRPGRWSRPMKKMRIAFMVLAMLASMCGCTRIAGHEAKSKAVEYFRSGDKEKRLEAVKIASTYVRGSGTEWAIEIMRDALASDDEEIRQSALPATERLVNGDAEIRAAVLSLLKSPEFKTRLLAVSSLASVEKPDSVTGHAVVEMLGDEHLNVRLAAIKTISGYGVSWNRLDVLFDYLRHEKDAAGIKMSLSLMGEKLKDVDGFYDELNMLLTEENKVNLVGLLDAVPVMERLDASTVDAIKALRFSADEDVASAAENALSKINAGK
jgi:hypothetical protein